MLHSDSDSRLYSISKANSLSPSISFKVGIEYVPLESKGIDCHSTRFFLIDLTADSKFRSMEDSITSTSNVVSSERTSAKSLAMPSTACRTSGYTSNDKPRLPSSGAIPATIVFTRSGTSVSQKATYLILSMHLRASRAAGPSRNKRSQGNLPSRNEHVRNQPPRIFRKSGG